MIDPQVLDFTRMVLRCNNCGVEEKLEADIMGKVATQPGRDPAFDVVKAQALVFRETHSKCERREPDALERIRTLVGAMLDGNAGDEEDGRELAREVRAIDEKLVAAGVLPPRDLGAEPAYEPEDIHAAYEKIALEDHALRAGKTVLVEQIRGYKDGDSIDIHFDKLVLVQILPTDRGSLTHWGDEDWLDPYWDIRFVGDAVPEEAAECSSVFMDGPSYNVAKGHVIGHFIDAPRELGGIA